MTKFISGFSRKYLGTDVLAGLTTAAVVIPKCMAYAVIAGLPVESGLYVAIVPMFIYAMLGSSRELSVSSTVTIAILTGAQLVAVVPDGNSVQMLAAASALALVSGCFLLLAGVLRLGFLANFVSDPVLTGFKAGIALVIVVDQFPKLLGVHIEHTGFFRDILAIIPELPHANIPTTVLAVLLLVLIFGLERFSPRVPAPLVAVILSIVIAALLGLEQSGVELTGTVKRGLPLPMLPDFSLIPQMWQGALGIALMSFTESVAASRTFARRDDPNLVPNRELFVLGAANVAGSLYHSLPAGGGTSQTAVNFQAGVRSQFASIVTVASVILTLLFLAPTIGLLPKATLAAVVVVTTLPLFSLTGFKAILRVRRTEFIWAVITCVGVTLIGTLQGILLAIAISVLTLAYESARPPVYIIGRKPGTQRYRPLTGEHPDDETLPGLMILRTEGRMNFTNAPVVGEKLKPFLSENPPKVMILEMSAVPDIEYTALHGLMSLEERLRSAGTMLWLAGLNPEVLKVIRRSPLAETLGVDRTFANLREAVEAYETRGEGSEST